ncbi:MAG: DeoR/GlpR family DNA-binding transcription regulator [Azospirillaceae bacterium]|nr:DeoR/GlpR family DNA-binding transcription regulator [Azospirillaceae bacterium]
MLTQQRKAHILDVLNRDGQIVAKELSHALGLSEDTIRRDLRELAAEGLLQRVHGGALPASLAVADFAGRQQVATEGKAAIGRAAARLVRPGQVVFVDGGTTAVQMARHLAPDLVATVVTHSPSVAVALLDHPGIAVELIGGRLFKHSVVAVGAAAIEAIARVRADTYFMGVTGVHPDVGLTTGDSEEAAVKRALCRFAAETVVMASREKLGAASPYLVVPLAEVDTLLIEPDAPVDLIKRFRDRGVDVVTA